MSRARKPLGSIALVVATCAPSCASLDAFLYSPVPVDAYALSYDDSVPASHRVPESQRDLLTLTADDGSAVYAVFARQSSSAFSTAPTIVYHHGNANNIDYYWARVGHLWSFGANVLVYDYPGYGRTPGNPTEQGIYTTARAATAYVRSLGDAIDQSRIFHYGYSLGGGPALEVASKQGPYRGLMTESAFTSVAALVADGSLVVPSSFVTTNVFDNLSKIRAAAASATNGALLLHGTADDFVQPKYAQQLEDAIGDAAPHERDMIDGADHDTVPDSPVYDDRVRAMLAR
ncbi:MAG: alpha/beta hydrolase [Polyangiales bacterium]